MTAKLNWGILTTGLIARKFATDLRQSQTGRLVAVGARRLAEAEKFSADFGGARAYAHVCEAHMNAVPAAIGPTQTRLGAGT